MQNTSELFSSAAQFLSNPVVTLVIGFALSIVSGRISNSWHDASKTGSKRKNFRSFFRRAGKIARSRYLIEHGTHNTEMIVLALREIVSSVFVLFTALAALAAVYYSKTDNEHYYISKAFSGLSLVLYITMGFIFISNTFKRVEYYKSISKPIRCSNDLFNDINEYGANLSEEEINDLIGIVSGRFDPKKIREKHRDMLNDINEFDFVTLKDRNWLSPQRRSTNKQSNP